MGKPRRADSPDFSSRCACVSGEICGLAKRTVQHSGAIWCTGRDVRPQRPVQIVIPGAVRGGVSGHCGSWSGERLVRWPATKSRWPPLPAGLASFVCRPTADAGVRFRRSIPLGCGTDSRGKVMRCLRRKRLQPARQLKEYSALPEDTASRFCYCQPLCAGDGSCGDARSSPCCSGARLRGL
jgi:hypothetical protein